MPITDLSYEDMQKLAADHVCGCCGSVVGVAWINGQWALRCGNDITHNTVTRHDKEYESQIQEIRRVQKLDSKSLMTMPEAKMIERVGMAKFPQDLTPGEKRLLAQVAITYGFDPLMGEVTIYQGRPWVSIDGRYRKAQETGELDGVETRPANKQERADWEIPDGDYFFRTEVYRKGAHHSFVGWGRVRHTETIIRDSNPGDAKKPTVTNPQRMAEKRAEAQGLRKGFHIPLPSVEDIGTPEADIVQPLITATVEVPPAPAMEASKPPTESTTTPTEKQDPPASSPTKEETGKNGVAPAEITAEQVNKDLSRAIKENLLSLDQMKTAIKNLGGKGSTVYQAIRSLPSDKLAELNKQVQAILNSLFEGEPGK